MLNAQGEGWVGWHEDKNLMFDVYAITYGGIQLIALVFGLTQFIKEAVGWTGKKVTLLAAGLGILVMVAYQLIDIVAEPYGQILGVVFGSVAFGLSASGYYKFATRKDGNGLG